MRAFLQRLATCLSRSATVKGDASTSMEWKYDAELAYWRHRMGVEHGVLKNGHYRRLMLAMAGEDGDGFLTGRIVADFGCGPRGSLCWAGAARSRIGIDVLASRYVELGIRSHDMTYVVSSESHIPLPDKYVDILFSMNALDHVADLRMMCGEMRRIVAPGGMLIGSFNLDEPPSVCEPQTLTEEVIEREVLAGWLLDSKRLAPRGPDSDVYKYFFESAPDESEAGGTKIAWIVAHRC